MTTQPLFELSLFGMIDVEQLNTLKTRLCGICGDATSNNSSFATWEVVLKAKSTPHTKTESETVKSKTKSTTKAAELNTLGISASHMQPQAEQINIRVQSDLKSSTSDIPFDQREWKFVKNVGKDFISKDRILKTATKGVNFSKIHSDNILEFLQAIEVEYDFEFIKKGFRYYTQSQICISVYQVYSMGITHAWNAGPEHIKSVDDNHYLVEMNCVANFDAIKDVETEMLVLADNLASIVHLVKEVPKK